jgi:hypothetical protein
MTPTVLATLADLCRDGPLRFAGWNAAVFDAVAASPAVMLADRFRGQPDADAVVAGYLRLAHQAVGTGVLTRSSAGVRGWGSFLERLVAETLPAGLPDVAPARRTRALVEAWNLGEGLLREPAWLDRYVNACAGGLRGLDDLAGFLARTLGPVMTPAPPSSWTGRFRVSVLDLRPAHDEFLPGRVRLAAPTVLCVDDRRREGLQVGVLLRPDGRSELLGVLAGLGEYPDTGPVPPVEFGDGKATVNGRAVPVPTLRRCHGFAVARAGYVAAAAVDSQRLWVIESE